ncbi:hypothetical protein C6P46_004118 [Rhodotorula mucilaginosa]|uniref:Uncharacterized protein n=1 Tax=Rhodotorula mucilaginosa TaxID=5537 RepID=A0A9P7B5S2_RHOMI|nr:hypothetical protein C6P46_004118 [Rhodotorula mucilaginosa]
MPSRPSSPSRRTPALIASAASVLLASGLAVSLAVAVRSIEAELDSDDEAIDLDQTAVAVWWAGDVALRWAFISAAGSLCGVLGLVLRKSKLHAVFALTTAFDLLATIFLTLTLLLLTFSPSLSEPFGDFVCSSSYASDFSASARALLARPSEHATSSWSNGIELAFWGVEACEDAWQTAMVRVLVGCAVTIALRAYGTWVTWDANVEMKDLEDRGLGGAWSSVRAAVDETGVDGERGENVNSKGMVEKMVRRLSSSSGGPRPTARYTPLALEEARSSRTLERRSNTFPHPPSLLTSVDEKRRPTRAQSDDIRRNSSSSSPNRRNSSAEPRLVLVPFVIDSLGHAVYEPSSPTLHMPPPQQQQQQHECGAPARRSLSTLSTRPSPPSPRPRSMPSSSSSSSSSCPSLSASASSSAPSSPATATSPASPPPPPPPPLTPPLIFTDEPGQMSSSSTSPARCQSNSTKSLDSAANRPRWTRAQDDDDLEA